MPFIWTFFSPLLLVSNIRDEISEGRRDVEHQDLLLERQETIVQDSEEHDGIDFLSAIYDIVSIFETIVFSILGYIFLEEEELRTSLLTIIAVIAVHVFGIIAKLYYYTFMHRWINRKSSHKFIKYVFWAMFIIYFISLGVALYWYNYIPKESLVFMVLIPAVSF